MWSSRLNQYINMIYHNYSYWLINPQLIDDINRCQEWYTLLLIINWDKIYFNIILKCSE